MKVKRPMLRLQLLPSYLASLIDTCASVFMEFHAHQLFNLGLRLTMHGPLNFTTFIHSQKFQYMNKI